MDLTRLLSPKRVAVVGASPKPGKVGEIVTRQLVEAGFEVYPVHPKETVIHGRKVLSRVEDLPDGVDLAVVTLGAQRAVPAAVAAADRGIPFVVVVAGGFREAGGADLEAELVGELRKRGTRLLGPNTLGLMDARSGLDTLFVQHVRFDGTGPGRIAFISQSGSVGTEATALASWGGLELASFIGLGNKSDLSELDFLEHYASREDVDTIMLYLETVSGGRPFLEAARRAALTKPVVVLKAGRSGSAAKAVASHTGSLAGSYRVLGGAFRQFGLVQATSDEEMMDMANALALAPVPRGNKVGIFTPAGGFGVMAVDETEQEGAWPKMVMARPSQTTQKAIKEASFPFVATGNPVDLTASVTVDMYAQSLKIFASDPDVDILVAGIFFSPAGLGEPTAPAMADAARWVVDELGKPVVMFVFDGERTFDRTRYFHSRGLPAYPSVRRAVRAARALVERSEFLRRHGS